MIDPQLLCRKHLLGEHGEIHKHRHNFVKHQSIAGRISPVVQIEPSSMKSRHDDLVAEMLRRGYNHNSPYEQPDLSYLPDDQRYAIVDISISMADLYKRCEECKSNIDIRMSEEYFEAMSNGWG